MNTDELIASIQNAPEFLHLKKEVIELPGREEPFIPARKMLILEQCGLTTSRKGRIEADVKGNPINYEFIDPLDQFGAARLYSDLASISFGDVPSLLEFTAMIEADTAFWFEKAAQINPAMFEWISEMIRTVEKMDMEYLKSIAPERIQPPSAADEKELIKKKARTRQRSSSG